MKLQLRQAFHCRPESSLLPPSSTPDSDPTPLPAAFHGGTVRASGPSLLDALAHPASPQQKTDGSERSPLVASTHTVTPERRDVPLQNQPANSDNAGSEDTAVSVTTAPAASASQAETAANVLPNSNIPAGTAASQSLNSTRKANSGEPGRAGQKRRSQPCPIVAAGDRRAARIASRAFESGRVEYADGRDFCRRCRDGTQPQSRQDRRSDRSRWARPGRTANLACIAGQPTHGRRKRTERIPNSGFQHRRHAIGSSAHVAKRTRAGAHGAE